METGCPFPKPVRATCVPENRRAPDNINGFPETSGRCTWVWGDTDRLQFVCFVQRLSPARITEGAFMGFTRTTGASYQRTWPGIDEHDFDEFRAARRGLAERKIGMPAYHSSVEQQEKA